MHICPHATAEARSQFDACPNGARVLAKKWLVFWPLGQRFDFIVLFVVTIKFYGNGVDRTPLLSRPS